MKKVLLDYLWIWSITAAILLVAFLSFPEKQNPLENVEKRLDEGSAKFKRLEMLLWGVYPFILGSIVFASFI